MSNPEIVRGETPIEAWSGALQMLLKSPGGQLGPVIVDIAAPSLEELKRLHGDADIAAINASLTLRHKPTVGAVASTIFPLSMWRTELADSSADLYRRYRRLWGRLKARCPLNRRGTYFQRLIALAPGCPGVLGDINQLQHIAGTYRSGNHRRSALVASIFDPATDHNNCRQLGFPCLHQVGIVPESGERLNVVGYYTLQYHFDRALGNYLGLCALAHFMASQLDLVVGRVQCIASALTLGSIAKRDVRAQGLERLGK